MAVKFKVVDRAGNTQHNNGNPITKSSRLVPWATTGSLGDPGYSIMKAIAYKMDQCSADAAKHEIAVHDQTMGLLKQKGFTLSSHKGMLVPISSAYIEAMGADSEGNIEPAFKKLGTELRQKMAATIPNNYTVNEMHRDRLREKANWTTNDSTLGGSLVAPPVLGEVIELQRNFEAFSRAGCRNMPMPPNGRISFPKQTGAGTAYWVGELAALTASNPTTGQLNLEAKKLGALYGVSDEMLRFANPESEMMLRQDLAAVLGLEADARMFDGTGGTQIKGLLTYPTATSWTSGTDRVLLYVPADAAAGLGNDGNTFLPQNYVKMTHMLPDPVQNVAKTWLLRTLFAQNIMAKRADAVTAGDQAGPFVFSITRDSDKQMNASMYGSSIVQSANVPGNRVKGSSGATLTVAILGAFTDWIIARSGVLEIMMNPFETTAFTNVYNLLRAIQYIDAGPRHLASFVYADTLLQTA